MQLTTLFNQTTNMLLNYLPILFNKIHVFFLKIGLLKFSNQRLNFEIRKGCLTVKELNSYSLAKRTICNVGININNLIPSS